MELIAVLLAVISVIAYWFAAPITGVFITGENAARVRALADREPVFDVAAMGHGEPIGANGDDALRALASRLS